jgi:hypothetical protein
MSNASNAQCGMKTKNVIADLPKLALIPHSALGGDLLGRHSYGLPIEQDQVGAVQGIAQYCCSSIH